MKKLLIISALVCMMLGLSGCSLFSSHEQLKLHVDAELLQPVDKMRTIEP